MSKSRIFQLTGGLKPGVSMFDLSYEKKFTCDMGQLIPVMCDEVVPGDSFKVGTRLLYVSNLLSLRSCMRLICMCIISLYRTVSYGTTGRILLLAVLLETSLLLPLYGSLQILPLVLFGIIWVSRLALILMVLILLISHAWRITECIMSIIVTRLYRQKF